MERYVIIDTGKGYDLHRFGCRDLMKVRFHDEDIVYADTARQAVDKWIDPDMQELGYSPSDVRILPCAV